MSVTAIRAGTSVYDAYAKIDAAIDYCVGLGSAVRLVFPTGKYRCDTPLGYYTGNDVTIDFNGSTIDFSNVSTATIGPLIGFQGTYGATAALTSNATRPTATPQVCAESFEKRRLRNGIAMRTT